MKHSYKICFLGYENLSDIARQVIQEGIFQDLDVLLLECTPDNLPTQLEYATQHGCEAFIAGSSNATAFRRLSNMPLTEIQIQTVDYALALKKAFAMGNLPILFTYCFSNEPNYNLLHTLVEKRFLHITYEDTYDLIQKLNSTQGDVIIGASLVTSLAQEYGKKSVFLYPGTSSVEDAFRRCQTYMHNLYTHNRNQVIYSNIIKNDVNGIIFTTESGNITLYNPAAEKLTGIPAQQIRKHRCQDIFPWVNWDEIVNSDNSQINYQIDLNGQAVEVTLIKTSVNNNTLGILILLSSKLLNPDVPVLANTTLSHPFSHLVQASAKMLQTIETAKSYSMRKEPCVIIGEAGTGKVSLASAMHIHSMRSTYPIYHINCSTIAPRQAAQYFWGREDFSENIISQGVLERCNHGTLILERIADANSIVQDCLTYVIKANQIQRLNGINPISLDIRLIAVLTPQEWNSLRSKISPELFYALTQLILYVPPLRERQEDIALLFEDFVNEKLSLRTNHFSVSKSLSVIFEEYSWPGNLRELKNVACRFAIQIEKLGKVTPYMQRRTLISSIGEDILFHDIVKSFGDLDSIIQQSPGDLPKLCKKLKDIMFYNNDQIASKLNISRTTLWRLLNNT